MSSEPNAGPTFLTYLQGYVTQVLMHLGEIDNPLQGGPVTNLGLAKQSIDLLQIIADKTEGNLTDEEEKFLKGSLYDLRMKFVAKSR
jgi:hypothetical protein